MKRWLERSRSLAVRMVAMMAAAVTAAVAVIAALLMVLSGQSSWAAELPHAPPRPTCQLDSTRNTLSIAPPRAQARSRIADLQTSQMS